MFSFGGLYLVFFFLLRKWSLLSCTCFFSPLYYQILCLSILSIVAENLCTYMNFEILTSLMFYVLY
jgi:hypothetical protein